MKKSLIRLFALLLIGTSTISAQDYALSASFGAASFRMDDLKYLQGVILESYPVEGKIISSFPIYAVESISAFRQFSPALRIGAGYVNTTTGGRSDYSDYSGHMETDISAASHRLGIFASYRVAGSDPLELSVYGRLDANISRIEILTTIYVLGLSDGAFYDYKSVSPNASAGLELLYRFKQVSIGLEGGYLVDKPGKLSYKKSGSEVRDPNDRDRILTTDWSGFRTGIKAIIWLDW